MGKCTEHKRDTFYRKAKELGYRARSAFKLLQLNDEFQFLNPTVERAVDLCAAPGSWSQVLSQHLVSDNARIVAVDLQEMAPVPGVEQIQGDITSQATADRIISYFNEGEQPEQKQHHAAQLVICDGAPDVTGVHDLDEFIQSELLLAALCITTHILEPEGVFVAKIFHHHLYGFLESQMRLFFKSVTLAKPESSREASREHFVVCQGFQLPRGYTPTLLSQYLNNPTTTNNDALAPVYVNYLTNLDLSGYDKPHKETKT